MKLKRILSVVLLLSICLGALVSCAVSATEPNEQPDAPAAPNKTEPLNGDEVKISTDSIVGETWRAYMSGEIVPKKLVFQVTKWVNYNRTNIKMSLGSAVAIDTVLNMLEELDDAVIRRVSAEEIAKMREERKTYPSKLLDSFSLIVDEYFGGSSYRGIDVTVCENHICIGNVYFETKESLQPWAEQLRAYFDQLGDDSYEGVGSNYKLGRTWLTYVDEDAALSHMTIGFRVDSKYGLRTNWTGATIKDDALRKEVFGVLKTLDSMTFEEADICGCCIEEHWTPLDLGFTNVKLYDENKLHILTIYIYREGLHIVNEQTYVDVCVTTSLDKSNYEQCKRLKEIVAAQAQINRELDYEKRREQ